MKNFSTSKHIFAVCFILKLFGTFFFNFLFYLEIFHFRIFSVYHIYIWIIWVFLEFNKAFDKSITWYFISNNYEKKQVKTLHITYQNVGDRMIYARSTHDLRNILVYASNEKWIFNQNLTTKIKITQFGFSKTWR